MAYLVQADLLITKGERHQLREVEGHDVTLTGLLSIPRVGLMVIVSRPGRTPTCEGCVNSSWVTPSLLHRVEVLRVSREVSRQDGIRPRQAAAGVVEEHRLYSDKSGSIAC